MLNNQMVSLLNYARFSGAPCDGKGCKLSGVFPSGSLWHRMCDSPLDNSPAMSRWDFYDLISVIPMWGYGVWFMAIPLFEILIMNTTYIYIIIYIYTYPYENGLMTTPQHGYTISNF